MAPATIVKRVTDAIQVLPTWPRLVSVAAFGPQHRFAALPQSFRSRR